MNLLSYVYVEKLPSLKFGFRQMYFLVHFTMLGPKCKFQQHSRCHLECHGQIWKPHQFWDGFQVDKLPCMWWWLGVSRHLVWGDYTNKGASCHLPHWWALCGTSNKSNYPCFEQIILSCVDWRYVTIFVFLFFK